MNKLKQAINATRGMNGYSMIFITKHAHLLFLPCLMCASYEHELYICYELNHVIFTEVQSLYFCGLVVSASSLLSRVLAVAVLLV